MNKLFKVNDIVTYKVIYDTPMGERHNSLFELVPYRICDVIVDEEYMNRVGEIGCCNRYVLERIFDTHDPLLRKRQLAIQYELIPWNEVKDDVIEALKTRIIVYEEV